MKKLCVYFSMMLLAASAAVLFAQASERPTPWFTLSIQEEEHQAWMAPGTHVLQVEYTNISNVIQKDNCVVSSWVYNMVVLRDGVPLEKKKPQRKSEDSDQDADSGRVRIHSFELRGCGRTIGGLDPGRTVKFTLWPSAEYDMTQPGTYTVTVKRDTYPFDPAKSVTVWSNTITIVVPPAN